MNDHENGEMGYFWYWTCFTHDNSEYNPIIVNCWHSEFIVSYSEITGLGIERDPGLLMLPSASEDLEVHDGPGGR